MPETISREIARIAALERVPPTELAALVKNMFLAAKVSAEHADLAAEAVMYATMRGVTSHGAVHMPLYLIGLLDGTIKNAPNFVWSGGYTSSQVLDADNGLGLVASRIALDKAIEFAKACGVGAVAVRNSSHFGAAGYYAELAAQQNLIAVASCNASPALAPTGGKEPLLGTNPIAAGFPVPGSEPIIIDMATTLVARSRIRLAKSLGETIPPDWAFDADGNPTTDPSRAIEGTLQPIGGAKGYGLSLMVELLCSALSDGLPGFEVNYENLVKRSSRISHFFLVLNPQGFAGLDRYDARAEHIAAVVSTTKRIDPNVPPRLPGARGHAVRKEFRQGGIVITEGLRRALSESDKLLTERLAR
jgi:LDH2 family malate/lactate/ureidoglycolate dehydrogenase